MSCESLTPMSIDRGLCSFLVERSLCASELPSPEQLAAVSVMGGLISAPADDPKTAFARDLRLALRAPDLGGTTPVADASGSEAAVAAATTTTAVPPRPHRSVAVLQLLDRADTLSVGGASAITVEHVLELVDHSWQEPDPGAAAVVARVVELAPLAHVRSLAIQCVLNQRCWLALDLALHKLLAAAAKPAGDAVDALSGTASRDDADDAAMRALFAVAALGVPVSLLPLLLDLGWVQPRAGSAQLRALVGRLARIFAPPRSPEESAARERARVDHATRATLALARTSSSPAKAVAAPPPQSSPYAEADGNVAATVVAALLRRLSMPLPTRDDVQAAVELLQPLTPAAPVVATLRAYAGPWSQGAAAVGEVPLSWRVARPALRRRAVSVALALRRRGLTFTRAPSCSRFFSRRVTSLGDP
jgi:hypothetical protein